MYTTNQKGLIIYKTKHKQIGKRHDYKIYKKNHPDIPKDIVNMFDLGFLGVEKEYPDKIGITYQKEEESGINERGRRVQ